MRTYDIAYVPQGNVRAYPAKPLQDLTLEEIKRKYIAMCAKANGQISVCSTCLGPCEYGKRAIELLANEVTEDKVPLYNGMTLVERAKQENLRRRQKLEQEKESKENTVQKKSKDNRLYIKDWYSQAIASGDPIKWAMEHYGIDKIKARAKIYAWERRHKIRVPETSPEKYTQRPVEICAAGFETVEAKINSLMKQQEEYKKMMEDLQAQYDKAKISYETIGKKIDVLCSAVDIINE